MDQAIHAQNDNICNMIRFVNPIPFVRDIQISKDFYSSILKLGVEEEHDDFVRFETGFAIHEARSLEKTIWGLVSDDITQLGRKNLLLYFEHDDIDALFSEVLGNVELIHPIVMQACGQRVFRFYDPDGHVIEIGEPQ